MANTSIQAAFERFWAHVVNALSGKSDISHTHSNATVSDAGFLSAEDKLQLDNGGSPIVTTAGTGAAYTATVDGITALTAGVNFIMKPHTVSTSTQPTLDVNGLGAKKILRRTTAVASGSQTGASAGWLLANYPFRVVYDGTVWIAVEQPKPAASDLQGTVAVNKGGTGKTTLTAGSYLVGNGTSAVALKTPAEVLANIGAASATDLTSIDERLSVLESSIATVYSGATTPTSDVGEDGDIYLVTE